MGLVLEKSAVSGGFEIYINGIRLEKCHETREYDCNNIEYPLDKEVFELNENSLYHKGENVLAVRVRVNGPEEGLLEPLRLFGDFLVNLNEGESLGAELKPLPEDYRVCTGSWTHQGFPHYSGSGIYEQAIVLDTIEKDCRYKLGFNSGSQAAEVFINGKSAGIAAWEPFEVDITGFLRQGTNRIGIKVTNTLENLLYGVQKPAGLLGSAKIYRFVFDKRLC
jgi:hypothetical protein